MTLFRLTALAVVATGVCCSAFANFALTERLSSNEHSWFYGYGPDNYSDSGTLTKGDLLASDTFVDSGSAHGVGYYPPNDHHWEADVSYHTMNSYSLTGSLTSASALSVACSSDVALVNSGATVSSSADQPGSELQLHFTLPTAQTFRFVTDQALNTGYGGANTSLYYWNGSSWVLGLLFIQPHEDYVWNLGAADYLLVCNARATTGIGTHSNASLAWSMQAVPEPGTWAALGLGGLAVLRRRRK